LYHFLANDISSSQAYFSVAFYVEFSYRGIPMDRITPKIFNGDSELILSETFCCDSSKRVCVQLPITPGKIVDFYFDFKADEDKSNRSVQVNQNENTLTFTLLNFANALGASLSKPFEFGIGRDRFFLQICGMPTGEQTLCLTVSIFRGAENA
jgi:hypothetical protein